MTERSTHERIVGDYYRTTSSMGSASSQASFDASVAGMRRRLGPWLNLAGKDVLDLGSGTGELCRLAMDCGARSTVGVNLSGEEIEYARKQSMATFVCQDIGSYLDACAPESVDSIFALNILEHLDKDKLMDVLEGSLRALRPGGFLVAMVPNATSPFGGMTRYWDITHLNAFTPSSLRQLASLAGFTADLEYRECGPVAYGLKSSIRYVLWRLIRLCIRGYLLVETASDKGGIYTSDMLVRFTKPHCAIGYAGQAVDEPGDPPRGDS